MDTCITISFFQGLKFYEAVSFKLVLSVTNSRQTTAVGPNSSCLFSCPEEITGTQLCAFVYKASFVLLQ